MSHEHRCGRSVNEIRGRLPRGFVRIQTTGTGDGPGRWFCSADCAINALAHTVKRADVATCPLCINRHDRDHRCPACGSRPQLTAVRPTPAVRLYPHTDRNRSTA